MLHLYDHLYSLIYYPNCYQTYNMHSCTHIIVTLSRVSYHPERHDVRILLLYFLYFIKSSRKTQKYHRTVQILFFFVHLFYLILIDRCSFITSSQFSFIALHFFCFIKYLSEYFFEQILSFFLVIKKQQLITTFDMAQS